MSMGDAAFAAFVDAICVPSAHLATSLEVLLLSRNNLHGQQHALTHLTRLLQQFVRLRFLDVCGNAGLFRFDNRFGGNNALNNNNNIIDNEDIVLTPAGAAEQQQQQQQQQQH
jgi:hypothetical protein